MKLYLGIFLILSITCSLQEETSKLEEQKINWVDLGLCLSQAAHNIPEIYDLIKLIEKEDYHRAYAKLITLISRKYNQLDKCIAEIGITTELSAVASKKMERPIQICFKKCQREKNLTLSETKDSEEFKECVIGCEEELKKKREEWELKKAERIDNVNDCVEECEKLKKEGGSKIDYRKCVFKCKKPRVGKKRLQ